MAILHKYFNFKKYRLSIIINNSTSFIIINNVQSAFRLFWGGLQD